jgi:hypothetical protein
MYLSCESCVLPGRGRGPCDGRSLGQRSPADCVVTVCDLQASRMRRLCCAYGVGGWGWGGSFFFIVCFLLATDRKAV